MMTEKEIRKKRNEYLDLYQRARNSLKRLTDLESEIEVDEELPEEMRNDLIGMIEQRTDEIYHFYIYGDE